MATPAQNGASEVAVRRAAAQQPRAISQVASAVLACVGLSERGPMFTLTECATLEGFKATFGDYAANNLDTMAAVEGWFSGGGGTLFFSRTCHHTTPGDPTTKTSAAASLNLKTASGVATAGFVTGGNVAPFALSPGQTIVANVDATSNQTATFNATAASRTSGNTAPFALANNDTLTVSINGATAVPVAFLTSEFVSIGAATALEVAAVINAAFAAAGVPAVASVSGSAVVITTNRKGLGASVNISAGSAQASGKLNFTAGLVAGTGNVQDIANVTVAEVKTIVEAAITNGSGVTVSNVGGEARITSNTTGSSSSIQVINTSTATGLGFDNAIHSGTSGTAVNTVTLTAQDGSYANTITAVVAAATSGDATKFDFKLLQGGIIKDTFVNVSMDPTSPRYVLDVVNGNNSLGITLADLLVAASPANLPAAGTFGPMAGGGDGLASLNDNDFIGGVSGSGGKTGLRAVDADEGAVTLLIVPQRATAAVHNAAVTYCTITRAQQMFAILDPPAGQTVAQMATYVTSTAALTETSEVAAIYYPRIKVATPNATLFGSANVVVPPSGDIAALYSRTDATKTIGGAFQQPGGVDFGIPRMLALESTEVTDKARRDILAAALVNPLSRESGTAFFVDGVLTLMSGGSFPSIGQSRGVLTVAKSLTHGLAFARHQNNTPELRQACSDLATLFLTQVTAASVLASRFASEAFTVDFGKGLNPPSVQAQRKIQGRVGLATAFPADYIFVDIFPDTRALDAELAAAA